MWIGLGVNRWRFSTLPTPAAVYFMALANPPPCACPAPLHSVGKGRQIAAVALQHAKDGGR